MDKIDFRISIIHRDRRGILVRDIHRLSNDNCEHADNSCIISISWPTNATYRNFGLYPIKNDGLFAEIILPTWNIEKFNSQSLNHNFLMDE